MFDENNDITPDESTEEVNEATNLEEPDENPPEQKTEQDEHEPSKEKEGLIERLMNKVLGKKDEQPNTGTPESNELEDDISENFENAARTAGWSDKQIIDLANKYSNADLEQLIPFIAGKKEEDKKPAEVKPEEKKAEEKKFVDTLNIDDKALKSYLEKIEKSIDAKYQEKFGKIEQGLKTAEQDRSNRESQQYQTTADTFFDKASKEFPVFGTTDKLMRFPEGTPQAGQVIPMGESFEARNAVWKAAMAFHAMGEKWETSLDEALVWYKGKNMEKDVRSKVLKDLKSKESKLSPKRSERKVNVKKSSPEEEKDETISDLMKRAGID